MRRTPNARGGFTLVELIVVVAIIGILIGLTLAGVQHVRMAAARIDCANRLRQIGLALNQYHAAQGAFPPGIRSETWRDPDSQIGLHMRLLPYVEQLALWQRVTRANADNIGSLDIAQVVPVFVCPLDDVASATRGDTPVVRLSFTSYQGSCGLTTDSRDGVLFRDSAVRLADITDGASNTLVMGERPAFFGRFTVGEPIVGYWLGAGSFGVEAGGTPYLGARQPNGYPGNLCPNPNHFIPGRVDDPCHTQHFWSFHPGGAQFAFCDGAVRFLSYASDDILPALATRAGGEPVQLP